MVQEQVKIKKLHMEMNEERKNGTTITLRQKLESLNYNPSDPSMALEKYFDDLDLNLAKVKISQFFDSGEYADMKWLVPEMIIGIIWDEIDRIFNFEKLLAFSVNATATTVKIPYVNANKRKSVVADDLITPIGVQFSKDSIKFAEKKIDLHKFGRAIELPYEYVKNIPFPLLATELKEIGLTIGHNLRRYVLSKMVNGDGGLDSKNKVIEDKALSIGVENQTTGIQYGDILTLSTRMWLKGAPATDMVADEQQYNKIKKLPEYSDRKEGSPDITLEEEDDVTTPTRIKPGVNDIGAKKLLLVCKDLGTGQFTNEGFQVETDKIISKQMHEATAWLTTGFANIKRKARCLIDANADFSDFPDYLQYDIPAAS